MKALSFESNIILSMMVGMTDGFSVFIDNAEGKYPIVYVSVISMKFGTRIVSVGNFTHKAGKVIADPEMHFWYGHKDGLYYPCYYRHDSLKIEQESMFVFGGVIKSTNLKRKHSVNPVF